MDDVSNKTVVMLLIATVVVSLGGAYISLNAVSTKLSGIGVGPITGFATIPNGTATLTISLVSSIQFSQPTVAFGTGSINTTSGNCTLSTTSASNSAGCIEFSEVANGFTIENDGNTNLSITLSASANAATFIEDGASLFLWNVTVNESGSCVNATGSRLAVQPNTTTDAGCGGQGENACGAIFEAVSTTAKNICPSLLFDDASDALNIDINVSIPVTAPAGAKSATLTITGAREPSS